MWKFPTKRKHCFQNGHVDGSVEALNHKIEKNKNKI
jgi:hypothetical protein